MAEVIVYLTLIGHDFDPEKVTRELGVIPTEVRYKNEVLNNGKMFGHTEWSYDTGKISTYDISNSFSCIISKFSGIVNIMREVADLYLSLIHI